MSSLRPHSHVWKFGITQSYGPIAQIVRPHSVLGNSVLCNHTSLYIAQTVPHFMFGNSVLCNHKGLAQTVGPTSSCICLETRRSNFWVWFLFALRRSGLSRTLAYQTSYAICVIRKTVAFSCLTVVRMDGQQGSGKKLNLNRPV